MPTLNVDVLSLNEIKSNEEECLTMSSAIEKSIKKEVSVNACTLFNPDKDDINTLLPKHLDLLVDNCSVLRSGSVAGIVCPLANIRVLTSLIQLLNFHSLSLCSINWTMSI